MKGDTWLLKAVITFLVHEQIVRKLPYCLLLGLCN